MQGKDELETFTEPQKLGRSAVESAEDPRYKAFFVYVNMQGFLDRLENTEAPRTLTGS